MSRQMRGFADYFMQGLQLGAGWAEKWEAGEIAKQRNKIMSERYAAQDRRENAKLGLYGESVRANAELARARAHAALNPKARGGGGGTAATPTDVTGLLKEANDQGIIATPAPVPPAAPNITVMGGSSDGGSDGGAVAPPVSEPPPGDDGYAKGGMVRRRGRRRGRRYAGGGIVEGMSLAEAQSYEGAAAKPEKKPAGGGVAGALGGALAKGVANYKEPEEKKAEEPKVTATGPVGSGPGGSYTTADTQSGGVLDTRYRAGGAVRGGPSSQELEDIEEKAWDDRASIHRGYRPGREVIPGTNTKEQKPRAHREPYVQGEMGERSDRDWPHSDTYTEEVPQEQWQPEYRRGGRVRKFQSGGRVMEAPEPVIDTGTSGPGSGYGYRAAPPARSY